MIIHHILLEVPEPCSNNFKIFIHIMHLLDDGEILDIILSLILLEIFTNEELDDPELSEPILLGTIPQR